MTKTEYLFGVKPKYFEDMKFYDAARERIRLAKQLLRNLVWDRDNPYIRESEVNERIVKVNRAIEFWEEILKERDESK